VTVIVGYLAGKAGISALHLGVEAARTLKTALSVVTVVPRPWTTPSPARIDAEYAQYADKLAADSAAQAKACIAKLDPMLEVGFYKYAHRSASGGLLDAVKELDAQALVLGSSADGSLGQVVVGSTADRLLHSSPVPLAISPRGYRGSKTHGLTRITCAYPGTPESLHVVERVAAFAARRENRSGIYSYEQRSEQLPEPYASRLRKNQKAWEFFQAQAPSYRKMMGWWIVSAKKAETRLKRLRKLIEESARRRLLR